MTTKHTKHPLRREPMPTFAEIVSRTFAAGVTFRRYGLHGELQRPMFHRFPASKLRGSIPASSLLASNVTRKNALLDRLKRKGR